MNFLNRRTCRRWQYQFFNNKAWIYRLLVTYAYLRMCILTPGWISNLTSINIFTLQYYDIRKKCEGSLCYDFSNMEKFLNQKSVRDALEVGDLDFVSCSPTVYQAMLVDWMRNLEVGIPTLLEDGIKLLVYAGEYDLICNWLGKLLCLMENQHLLS